MTQDFSRSSIVLRRRTIQLTDRRPDHGVTTTANVEQSVTQAEAEREAAVRVERFVRCSAIVGDIDHAPDMK